MVPEILRAKVSVFAELYRKTRALERLNSELEQRVMERTAALEATTAALQEADRRKDEFLAMLAHELRNPLAPIRTAGAAAAAEGAAGAAARRARDVIERQVDHLVALIDDLLDVSRITRGMITLQREPVFVGAIVARAVETARPAIDAHRSSSSRWISPTSCSPSMVTRPASFRSSPTSCTTRRSSWILGAMYPADGSPRRSICGHPGRGHGHGIAPDGVDESFELFTQVQTKSQPSQSGLGIGLALVRRLAEMHGGAVSVQMDRATARNSPCGCQSGFAP